MGGWLYGRSEKFFLWIGNFRVTFALIQRTSAWDLLVLTSCSSRYEKISSLSVRTVPWNGYSTVPCGIRAVAKTLATCSRDFLPPGAVSASENSCGIRTCVSIFVSVFFIVQRLWMPRKIWRDSLFFVFFFGFKLTDTSMRETTCTWLSIIHLFQ